MTEENQNKNRAPAEETGSETAESHAASAENGELSPRFESSSAPADETPINETSPKETPTDETPTNEIPTKENDMAPTDQETLTETNEIPPADKGAIPTADETNLTDKETLTAEAAPAEKELPILEAAKIKETTKETPTDDDIPTKENHMAPTVETSATEKSDSSVTDDTFHAEGENAAENEKTATTEGKTSSAEGETNSDGETAAADEEAALAGFSEDRDAYGREILERTFPNLLSMSVNSVKIDYSRLKNVLFSYFGLRSVFDGESELVKRGKDAVARFRLDNGKLSLALAIPFGSIDKKVYPHKKAGKDETEKPLQTVVTIPNRAARERAVELVSLTANLIGLTKNESAPLVAYAERFPVNRNAVLKGEEEIPPEENRYETEAYEDITGGVLREIDEANGVVRKKSAPKQGKEELAERRQTAKSVKAALALSEPIVYYYDVAVDKEDKPLFVNVRQVLNDKFLGKILPEQFFAVAEGSERIEQFNFLALEAAALDAERFPEYVFAVKTSVRLLFKAESRKKLLKRVSETSGNLALSLDCALLESAGETAVSAVRELRAAGAKILLDNSEEAGMRALTEFDYEFLRFDARYYREAGKKGEAHLASIAGYAKTLGVASVAANVETVKEAASYLTKGVGGVEGFIIEEPKRAVLNALKERKKLPAIRA